MTKPKRSKSQVRILQAAKSLFWKHGIRRVTVEEVSKEAGVSKMTFYRNFENKNDLSKQILIQLMERGQQLYDDIMHSDLPFPEKIEQLIKFKYEESKGVSPEFIKDIYQDKESELPGLMEVQRQKQMKQIRADFETAQEEGWIRKDLKLDFIMFMLNDLNAKAMDEHLNKIYPNAEDLIVELVRYFFKGILTKKAIS